MYFCKKTQKQISLTSGPVLTDYATQPTKGRPHAIECYLQNRGQYHISDIGKRTVVDLNADSRQQTVVDIMSM